MEFLLYYHHYSVLFNPLLKKVSIQNIISHDEFRIDLKGSGAVQLSLTLQHLEHFALNQYENLQTLQILAPFLKSLELKYNPLLKEVYVQTTYRCRIDLKGSDTAQLNQQTIFFGKESWETYFGEIGKEPSLPEDIEKILSRPCPFWPDKKSL
jgi:hypothetical protein